MIINYFKISFRNLAKNKMYSFISIAGLSIGIAITLLIFSSAWTELQTNSNLKNIDSQFIIRGKWKQPNMGFEDATFAPLAKRLKEEYPDLVANYYRFDVFATSVSIGSRSFSEEVGQAGDSTLLNMYGLKLAFGDAKTALSGLNSVIITERNAIKYFGKTNVVGEVLTLSDYTGGKQDFMVTGVLKDLEKNSITYLWDTPVNIFIPFNSLRGRTGIDNWNVRNIPSYIELREGVNKEELDGPIKRILSTNLSNEHSENVKIYITSLSDYYFDFNNGIVKKTIYTLSSLTIFILSMVIVNFINISIGNSVTRLREIGVRKVLGGKKNHIIVQFLTESIILFFVSTVLSLILHEIFRPLFNEIFGRPIKSLIHVSIYFWLFVPCFTLIIGLVSGLYPALILSNISSIDLLKKRIGSVKENLFFKRFLLTLQFSIALFVFYCSIVISK